MCTIMKWVFDAVVVFTFSGFSLRFVDIPTDPQACCSGRFALDILVGHFYLLLFFWISLFFYFILFYFVSGNLDITYVYLLSRLNKSS